MDTTTIETDAQAIATRALAVTVTDAQSYALAGAFLSGIKAYQDRVRAIFRPHIDAAHKTHKGLVAEEKRHLEAPIAAEAQVKTAMVTWAQAEQRRLDDARRQAETEARRIAEEQAIAEAAAAEAAGDHELAEAIVDQPVMVATPPVVRAAPKVAGIAIRTTWHAEVVNLLELVRAVAAGKAPLALLLPNLPAINAQARSLKGEARIAGVRVFSKADVSA